MTPINSSSLLHRQRGLTIVELMVSLTIGLVVTGALTVILLGSGLMRKTDENVSRMQENGRYAMETIGRAIRQAGYRLDVDLVFNAGVAAPARPLEGTDGNSAPNTWIAATSDTLTIRHDPVFTAVNVNGIRTGSEADCSGTIINANSSSANKANGIANSNLVVYTFSINNNQLICTTAAGANIVIADGIENLQIEYGIDNGSGTIVNYVNAGAVANFSRVAAVRVSLLVRSSARGTATNNTQSITYNGATANAVDGFLRQVYTSTFTVRNQAL